MVRYPHTAVVTVSEASIVEGELSAATETTQIIKGRLELVTTQKSVKTDNGDYVDLKGTFFTKADPITGASKIAIGEQNFSIVKWVEFQSYTEIWLD